MRLILAALLAAMLLGCTTKPNSDNATVTIVPVEFKSPNRLRFSGKGAGAGMMLMSSMGATGIAIGVAIDEGIGKDIAKALADNNYVFSEKLETAFQALDKKYKDQIQSIMIERYGFKTQSREGFEDAIVPEIRARIKLGNGGLIEINYPSGFNDEPIYVELEQAKVNGEIAAKTLNKAITQIMSKLKETL